MKKKVAAYCRVSTKEELQQYSLEAQKQYYKDLIEANDGFIFVGIYADTASGLKRKDRVQFEKMLKDCKRKKIDIIYTKSVSRFSRNTLDFLKVIRKLKQLDVDVYFQNEQIWLKKEKGELSMKKYVSPSMVVKSVMSEKNISSLNEWLQGAGQAYADAGVITYIMVSE